MTEVSLLSGNMIILNLIFFIVIPSRFALLSLKLALFLGSYRMSMLTLIKDSEGSYDMKFLFCLGKAFLF